MNNLKQIFHLIWPIALCFVVYYVLFGTPGLVTSLFLILVGLVAPMFVPQLFMKLKPLVVKLYNKIRDLLNI